MTLHGATVLVSGGSGFLGSHLVRRLTRQGAQVHVLLRPASSLERLADILPVPGYSRVDLDNAEGLRHCVGRIRPDVIFMAGGSTSDRGRASSDGEAPISHSDAANVQGTFNLLDAISLEAASSTVVRIGSLAEYGTGPTPFREDQREEPVSAYAVSQAAATRYGQSLFRQAGLAVTTLRLTLTYGPAQSDRFLIPSLIAACLDSRPFDLTSSDHVRDLVYVDDAIDAMIKAAAGPGLAGQVVNICSGRGHRIGDVAASIVQLAGTRTELRRSTGNGDIELQQVVGDCTRARETLAWEARTPLEEGLTRTIAWYRARRAL